MKCPYLQDEFDSGIGTGLKGPFPGVKFVVKNECEPGEWTKCQTCILLKQREQMPEEYEHDSGCQIGGHCIDSCMNSAMNIWSAYGVDRLHLPLIYCHRRVQGYGEE